MAISIPSDCRKFRAAVIPVFAFLFIIATTVLFCLILAADGWHFDRNLAAFAAGFEAICSFVVSWMLSRLYPDAISVDGIYGHSAWGRRHFVAWKDVAAARTFRLLNLQWLRVDAGDGRATWLALFHSQDADFRQEIQRLAPPDSPILKCV